MSFEWIKCSERLPKFNEGVLAARGFRVASMAMSQDGYWYTDGYGIEVTKRYKDVTHWMPLPAPPEEL